MNSQKKWLLEAYSMYKVSKGKEVTLTEKNRNLAETSDFPKLLSESKSNISDVSGSSIDLGDNSLYIHREISQLQFNMRVLEQSLDKNYPLLERLNFLLIFSSNLDEFFEIRVAGLKQQENFRRERIFAEKLQSSHILSNISEIVHAYVDQQYAIFNEVLLPALERYNVRLIRRCYWNSSITKWASNLFQETIAPIITPIGLAPTHPFPLLVNKSLNFIVELDGTDAYGRDSGLAIIPTPRLSPRVIRIPKKIGGDGENYVFLSSIIHAHADKLFQGMKLKGCYQFRLTRNADLTLDTEDVEDLARSLRGELLSRHYGDAVRLEVTNNCPKHLSRYLLKQFSLHESELYSVNGPVNLTRLISITGLESLSNLQHIPFTPTVPKILQSSEEIFSVLANQDILLLHPFQSFSPVVDFLQQAAKDPEVLAVRQTLYRTGANSDIVNSLVEAARNCKEVTVIIELRARFDEESNLQLASRLKAAGAVVIYGVIGFKTHAKMMLILRREGKKIVRYAHLGTGNYHVDNARLYTDYSLLTSNKLLCEDISRLFTQLIGMGKTTKMNVLLHAPFTLRQALLNMIKREVGLSSKGQPAYIIAKFNALTDPKIIYLLYKASQAGVRIELIVRGVCCLRPGIPGVSDNIQVRSIVGRFLEHTRVFYFLNGGKERLFLSSADWMERNLDKRIEIFFPILDKTIMRRIKKDLDYYLSDNIHSWILGAEGTYRRINSFAGHNKYPFDAQNKLLKTLGKPMLGQ